MLCRDVNEPVDDMRDACETCEGRRFECRFELSGASGLNMAVDLNIAQLLALIRLIKRKQVGRDLGFRKKTRTAAACFGGRIAVVSAIFVSAWVTYHGPVRDATACI